MQQAVVSALFELAFSEQKLTSRIREFRFTTLVSLATLSSARRVTLDASTVLNWPVLESTDGETSRPVLRISRLRSLRFPVLGETAKCSDLAEN